MFSVGAVEKRVERVNLIPHQIAKNLENFQTSETNGDFKLTFYPAGSLHSNITLSAWIYFYKQIFKINLFDKITLMLLHIGFSSVLLR